MQTDLWIGIIDGFVTHLHAGCRIIQIETGTAYFTLGSNNYILSVDLKNCLYRSSTKTTGDKIAQIYQLVHGNRTLAISIYAQLSL